MSLTLSLVMPAYNEEETLDSSLEEIKKELDLLNVNYEVIVVNDGSTDKSRHILEIWQSKWPKLRVLNFVTNRGHMAAITAGLEHALGEWVFTIDADLQDPPWIIREMFDLALREGVHVVYGVRSDRDSDSLFKRLSAKFYYFLIKKITRIDVVAQAADCRLMSRSVVNSLNRLTEKEKIYRLLVPWLGYKSVNFAYPRNKRLSGNTHYPLNKMLALAVNSVLSFSATPLRLVSLSGLIGLILCLIATIYVLYGWFAGNVTPGWVSIMLGLIFFGSLQLLSLGLLGEYILRIFNESQNRPIYELDPDSTK